MKLARSVPSSVLTPALRNVLESMYFCSVYPVGEGGLSETGIGAVVQFSGVLQASSRTLPFAGEFRILVSEPAARNFAAELLPSDPSTVTAEEIVDTVREFANVSCGAVLSAWMPKGEFNFAVPREDSGSAPQQALYHWYRIDGVDESASQHTPVPHLGVMLRIDARQDL